MGLISTIDEMIEKKSLRLEQAWRRYVEILNSPPTGKTEAELNTVLATLALPTTTVREHVAAIARRDELAAKVAGLAATAEAAREAQTTMGDELNRIERAHRDLEDAETRVRAYAQDAQSKLVNLREAEAELEKLKIDFAYLFDGGVPAPYTPAGREQLAAELADIQKQLDARRGRGDKNEIFRLERERNRLQSRLRTAGA